MAADWDPELLTHHACTPQWASLRSAFLNRQQRLWEGSFGLVDAEGLDRAVAQAMQQEELDSGTQAGTRDGGDGGDDDVGKAASALVLQKVDGDTQQYPQQGGDGSARPIGGPPGPDAPPFMPSPGLFHFSSGARGVSLSGPSMGEDDSSLLLDRLRSRNR